MNKSNIKTNNILLAIAVLVVVFTALYLMFFSGGRLNELTQVANEVPPVVTKENSLNSAYEVMPEKDKLCVKNVLGNGFDGALKDPNFHLTYENIKKMNECFSAGAVKPAKGGEK